MTQHLSKGSNAIQRLVVEFVFGNRFGKGCEFLSDLLPTANKLGRQCLSC
jgi:hypothetical protein